jgi:hypothetical protein
MDRDGVPVTRPFTFGYKAGAVEIVLRIVRRQIDRYKPEQQTQWRRDGTARAAGNIWAHKREANFISVVYFNCGAGVLVILLGNMARHCALGLNLWMR